jgi:hypothetical protein
MLLVVVEDTLNGLDTWVIVALVVFSRAFLVPIEDLFTGILIIVSDVQELDRRYDLRGQRKARSG